MAFIVFFVYNFFNKRVKVQFIKQYLPNMNTQCNSWILRPFPTDIGIFKDEDGLTKIEFPELGGIRTLLHLLFFFLYNCFKKGGKETIALKPHRRFYGAERFPTF